MAGAGGPGVTDERWLAVPGHENYEVSDLGRVRRSRPGQGTQVGRILRQRPNRDGYYYVRLSGGGDVCHQYVHRLVATAFLPQSSFLDVDLEAHHKKNDLSNNRLSNIEWVTPSKNKKHAWITRRANGKKEKASDPPPWETG